MKKLLKWIHFEIMMILWQGRQIRRLNKGLRIDRSDKPKPPWES